jgi:hypothetical protein
LPSGGILDGKGRRKSLTVFKIFQLGAEDTNNDFGLDFDEAMMGVWLLNGWLSRSPKPTDVMV